MEALPLAEAIQRFGAGQRIRRLTLFENLGSSAESGASRQLTTNSSRYGLTTGGYRADYLDLTEEGRLASGEDNQARLAARLQLGIVGIDPFNKLYERFKDNRLPSPSVLRDAAVELGVPIEHADECVQTFLANARDLGLLKAVAGAERILSLEHVLEDYAAARARGTGSAQISQEDDSVSPPPSRTPAPRLSPATIIAQATDLTDVCFFISPIGSDQSEQRKHADLVLGSLVEPALADLGLRVVRADKIAQPGLITAQVMEHCVKARLVIADLSFSNPNVFYELALRHACRKPVVQLIRTEDRLPFDVGQYRTVLIDMTNIYTLVPQLDVIRADIARQCRIALEAEGVADNPLSQFFPAFWDELKPLTGQT